MRKKMNYPGHKKEWGVVGSSTIITNPNKIEKNGQSQRCKQYFNFSTPRIDLSTHYEECPGEINVCIENDVDLPKIHLAIKSTMIFILRQHDLLIEEGNILISLVDEMDKNSLKYTKIVNRIKEIDEELEKINILDKWSQYEKESIPILNRYVEVMTDEVKGIISSSSNDENPDKIEERITLITQYIDLVKKLDLVRLNLSYKYDDSNTCPSCGYDMTDLELSADGRYVCKCGYYDDDTTQNIQGQGQTDVIKIPIPKVKPDILISMDKWLNRFLGTSEESFPEVEMFKKFDEMCIKQGWPTGEEVRNGNDNDADLDRLLNLMSLCKYPQYYKLRNIIRHRYWNWQLPTMTDEQKSRFRNKIVLSQEVYTKYALRKQNINQDIRGWYHIKDAGADFPLSWFKMTKNISTLEEADYVYELICKDPECDMTFYPILQRSET